MVNHWQAPDLRVAHLLHHFFHRLVVIAPAHLGAHHVVEPCVFGSAALGEAADRVEASLVPAVPVARAESLQEAVRRAFDMAGEGDTVLLAPACSSFDMFRDYAARGDAFRDEVRLLAQERAR